MVGVLDMTTNPGIQTLSFIIHQLRNVPGPNSVLSPWYTHRWEELAEHLERCAKRPEVNLFAADYARSLVADIMRLMGTQDWEAVAEATIEAVEDLVRQMRALAASLPPVAAGADEGPFLPGFGSPDHNTSLAMAA